MQHLEKKIALFSLLENDFAVWTCIMVDFGFLTIPCNMLYTPTKQGTEAGVKEE